MSSNAPPVADGEVLAGKYRVERVLGQGAHGFVVSARHVELDEAVAIKLLRKKSAKDPDVVERFLREARAAVRLKNDHVVRIFDVGKVEDGTPFIVMEQLVGRDLEKVLASRGALPVEEAVGFVLEACEAVAEAHAFGIVHRDLKLANLFLHERPDGTAILKVLDFGVAKWRTEDDAAKRLTGSQTGLGSPLYMAPEQITDAGSADVRADVWSIAVILHELLTNKSPFDAGSVEGVLAAVMTRPAPSVRDALPNAPRGLDETIRAALEKEPDKRTASILELARALEPYASAEARRSVARIARAATVRARASMTSEMDGPPSGAEPGPRADVRGTAISTTTDLASIGLPSRTRPKRAVVIGGALALVALVVGVFAIRGSSGTPDRALATPPPPVASATTAPNVPAPSAAAAIEETAEDATAVASAAPAAVPTSTAATTRRSPAASAKPPKPQEKKPGDVRSLIDGRR